MEKLHNKIKKLSILKLILVSISLMCVVQLLTTPFYRLYPINDTFSITFKLDTFSNFLRDFFLLGIVSPIIETLIFQALIIRVVLVLTEIAFMKESIKTYLIPIVISAIAFGFGHIYGYNSIVKVVNTFLIGVILAYTYIVAYITNKKATLCVMCVHIIWNVWGTLIAYIPLYLKYLNI